MERLLILSMDKLIKIFFCNFESNFGTSSQVNNNNLDLFTLNYKDSITKLIFYLFKLRIDLLICLFKLIIFI